MDRFNRAGSKKTFGPYHQLDWELRWLSCREEPYTREEPNDFPAPSTLGEMESQISEPFRTRTSSGLSDSSTTRARKYGPVLHERIRWEGRRRFVEVKPSVATLSRETMSNHPPLSLVASRAGPRNLLEFATYSERHVVSSSRAGRENALARELA